LLIAGPTASGKSALALRLARRLDGLLINADSMQLYRDLRILTARPSLEEESLAPHRLFGCVDGSVNHSVGLWLERAGAALEEARSLRLLPIFVGGTGLYFKALTQGLSEIPPVPEAIRTELRLEAQERSTPDLHRELRLCDPLMAARLKPNDSQRILRALEIFRATGRSLATFQNARSLPLLDMHACAAVFLAPDRDDLNRRIDARFDAMLAEGALAEVERLGARGLDQSLPVMRAHGVPHLLKALRGHMAMEEAIRQSKLDTRHYAKRQFTFARHQLPDFVWAAPEAGERALTRTLFNSENHGEVAYPHAT